MQAANFVHGCLVASHVGDFAAGRMTTTLVQTRQRCSRLWVTMTMVVSASAKATDQLEHFAGFTDAERRRRLVEKKKLPAPRTQREQWPRAVVGRRTFARRVGSSTHAGNLDLSP